jgi:hypothetical protein
MGAALGAARRCWLLAPLLALSLTPGPPPHPNPPLLQRYMFSATMPPAVERLARKYLRR